MNKSWQIGIISYTFFMARLWKIEYAGALCHVLSRENGRLDIFYDDSDRLLFLKTVGEMSERFEVNVCAYVLMGNHYRFLSVILSEW